MLPTSEPGGRPGTSRCTVPTIDSVGQLSPISPLWILACAGVHASRPCAADGLSVMPSGSVVVIVLTAELSSAAGFGSCGTEGSAVIPSFWSSCVVSGVRLNAGANGTRPQPERPMGLVYDPSAFAPLSDSSWILLVVARRGLSQLVPSVRTPPVPMLPLNTSRDLSSGNS